jgi:hypothetical protein
MDSTVHNIALAGGLFAVFTFIHFFVDWICQTHAEAMAKHNNPKVRARHCLIYTLGFVPLMYLLNFECWEWIAGLNILFWSHFVEDTYIPVYLWAKYVRKPPEMNTDPKKGFIEFITTPLGKILMIAVDQIIHLAFLFPLVWFALN